jgi:hypothetical protein
MVIFTHLKQESEKMAKPFKQVQINTSELREHINLIEEAVKQSGDEVRRYAQGLRPPYPFTSLEEAYTAEFGLGNAAQLELVCHSALLYMQAEVKNISIKEWQACFDEYANLTSADPSSTTRYKGIESPGFRNSILDVSEEIARYLDMQSVKPKYLMRGKAVNHRVIIQLAIIWLGRKLKAEREASSKPNPEAN